MIKRQLALAACAIMVLSVGSAYAGPCNTREKDAGSGRRAGCAQTRSPGSRAQAEAGAQACARPIGPELGRAKSGTESCAGACSVESGAIMGAFGRPRFVEQWRG